VAAARDTQADGRTEGGGARLGGKKYQAIEEPGGAFWGQSKRDGKNEVKRLILGGKKSATCATLKKGDGCGTAQTHP